MYDKNNLLPYEILFLPIRMIVEPVYPLRSQNTTEPRGIIPAFHSADSPALLDFVRARGIHLCCARLLAPPSIPITRNTRRGRQTPRP